MVVSLAGMTEPTPGGDPHVRALSASLLLRVEELGAELADRIRSVDPVYREGRIVTVDDLQETCRANLTLVFARLAGSSEINIQAPALTGRRRAEQGMPLPTTLRAYRIGGRFIWEVLLRHADTSSVSKEALLQAAGDVWAIIDDYSETVSEAFRDTVAEQARRDTQVRTAVLSSLLDGHLRDAAELQDAVAVLQLPRQGSYVVVAAQTRGPGAEPLPRVEQILRHRDISSVWRLDDQYQTGILCLPPRLSVERVCTELAALAAATIGVSEPYTALDTTPPGHATGPDRLPVSHPGKHRPGPLRTASGCDPARRCPGGIGRPGSFRTRAPAGLDPADRDLLLATLRSWFARGASAAAVGDDMHVHRNTVRYRLRRIEALTGRSLTDPVTIGELHIAMEAGRIFSEPNRVRRCVVLHQYSGRNADPVSGVLEVRPGRR